MMKAAVYREAAANLQRCAGYPLCFVRLLRTASENIKPFDRRQRCIPYRASIRATANVAACLLQRSRGSVPWSMGRRPRLVGAAKKCCCLIFHVGRTRIQPLKINSHLQLNWCLQAFGT
jgi:hypothetical protein